MTDPSTEDTPQPTQDNCAWAALRAGLWLDGVLFFGLLIVVAFRPSRWTEVYWVIMGTGLYKSVTTGVATYLSCRAKLRRAT